MKNRGVALVAVLWVVAALSVLATGIVSVVRSEIHIHTHQKWALQNMLVADAAILMVLQEVQLSPSQGLSRILQRDVTFQGQQVRVKVTPLNGYIDINNAPVTLLADLFQYAGGLPPQAAAPLAQAVVEQRARTGPQGATERFEAAEDLLRIHGIGDDLFVRIKNLLTVNTRGSGKLNPWAAPLPVLQVLAQGDAARAASLDASRNTSPEAMDFSTLSPAHTESADASSLRLEASVPLPDGGRLQRLWEVSLSNAAQTGLPWQVLLQSHSIRASQALGSHGAAAK